MSPERFDHLVNLLREKIKKKSDVDCQYPEKNDLL